MKPNIYKDLPSGEPEIYEGEEYSMECDFYGLPFPTIKWTKDGEDINDSNDFLFSEANRKLKIANMNHEKHDGDYQCTATNSKGSAKSSKAMVKVICKLKHFYFIFCT